MNRPSVKKDPIVGLIIKSDRIGFVYWLEFDEEPITTWHMLDKGEIHELVIYNMTALSGIMRGFLESYNLNRAQAVIAFGNESLYEVIIRGDPMAFLRESALHGYAWSTCSLVEPCVYMACFPYHVRAQYHLLSLKVPVKLVCMTTVTAIGVRMLLKQKALTQAMCNSMETLRATLNESSCISNPRKSWVEILYTMAQDKV